MKYLDQTLSVFMIGKLQSAAGAADSQQKRWIRLYFDVETPREKSDDAFLNEKVIAIGVIADRSEYSEESLSERCEPGPTSAKCEVKLFTEWGLGSEEAVIKKFYKYVEEIRRENNIMFVGFGVLRFDIPLLIQRAVEYEGVDKLAKYNKFWHDVYVIDIFQALLPLNGMRFKGLKLATLAGRLKEIDKNAPEAHGEGSKIYDLYKERKYSEIEEHLKADLRIVRYFDLAILSKFWNKEEERKRLFKAFGLNRAI